MIVFDLKCGNGHKFEAWFKGSDAYEEQRAAGVISCPSCGDVQVTKAPMAPNIASRKDDGDHQRRAWAEELADQQASLDTPYEVSHEPVPPAIPEGSTTHMLGQVAREFRAAMEKVREHVEENFDYVGREFAEEARKIHYGEVKARPIYGEASPEESAELKDEGVEVVSLPFPSRRDS